MTMIQCMDAMNAGGGFPAQRRGAFGTLHFGQHHQCSAPWRGSDGQTAPVGNCDPNFKNRKGVFSVVAVAVRAE